MSKETPQVTRETSAHDALVQEQEGGRSMAPPAFQLFANPSAPAAPPTAPPAGNQTGMPDQLKSGIEQLSGMDMSDVRVHYNSAQPAQLQAHAFAQGSDIHLASGQEQHLPHEAWHVVQQKQGRVQATKQLKGKGINDDSALEREADEMGAKAAQLKAPQTQMPLQNRALQGGAVQRMIVQIVPEIGKVEPKSNTTKPMEGLELDLSDIDFNLQNNQNGAIKDMGNGILTDFDFDQISSNFDNFDFDLLGEKLGGEDKIEVEEKMQQIEQKPSKRGLPWNDQQPKILTGLDIDIDESPSFGLFKFPSLFEDSGFDFSLQEPEKKKDLPPLKIGKVHIIGRPRSPFSGTMGDHTTAFGIHTAGLKLGLQGLTVREAVHYMWNLYGAAQSLPGYTTCKYEGKDKKTFDLLELRLKTDLGSLSYDAGLCDVSQSMQAKTLLKLQDAIKSYLEFREHIPLSVINVKAKSPALAGKGKGEATHIQQLRQWEESGEKPSKEDLFTEVASTFDPHAVAMTIIESNNELVRQMAPGLKPNQQVLDQIILFVKNHFGSLKMSFPNLGELIELNANVFGKAMETQICNLIIGRAFQESQVTNLNLKALGDQQFYLENQYANETSPSKLIDDPSHKVKKITDNNFIDKSDTYDEYGRAKKKKKKMVPQITVKEYYRREFKLVDDAVIKEKGDLDRKLDIILMTEGTRGKQVDQNLKEEWKYKIQNGDFDEEIDLEEASKTLESKERKQLEKEDRVQTLSTAVKYSFGDSVMDIDFAGRPQSPFTSGMGAHTTAWIVYQDWVREQLKGKSIQNAVETLCGSMFNKMEKRCTDILKLVDQDDLGYDISKVETAKNRFLQYAHFMMDQSPAAQKLMLQELINLFLSYINMIPGTTTDKADTSGHGEAGYRKKLQEEQWKNKLSLKNINGLLDIKGLPDAYGGDAKKVMRNSHHELVKEAYPLKSFNLNLNL